MIIILLSAQSLTISILLLLIIGILLFKDNNSPEKPIVQDETAARNKAEETYRRINSYSNPKSMNEIPKEWIVDKITEALIEYKDGK